MKKKKKTIKKPVKLKKFAFIQGWGTYSNETFVAVNMDFKQICFKMKSMKVNKEFVLDFASNKDSIGSFMTKDNNAMCWFSDGRSVLWFREWVDDWGHYDTLLHECYHLVHNILHKAKNMANDDEGSAYQLEYLFRELRRELHKRLNKK